MQALRCVLFLCATTVAAAQSNSPSSQPWQMQESGTTAGLRGIHSVDGTVAWASGTGGTILKTTDAGQHWQKCSVPDGNKDGTTLDFRGVQAWDANTAIVMASGPGDKSRLYKTTDGCKTWTLLYTNPDRDGFWDALVSDEHGSAMLLGDPVRGRFALWQVFSWRSVDLPGEEGGRFRFPPRARAGESAFAASNSALFVESAFFNFWFATGGIHGSRVIRRINHDFDDFAFNTFPSSEVPVGNRTASSGVFSLSFRPDRHADNHETDYFAGIAVGGDYAKANDSDHTAAYTLDSGKTWTASAAPPHGYRSAVQFSHDLDLWITAGTNGSDISRDDGRTWQPLDNGNWNALSLPFIVGPNGRIARLNPAALSAGK